MPGNKFPVVCGIHAKGCRHLSKRSFGWYGQYERLGGRRFVQDCLPRCHGGYVFLPSAPARYVQAPTPVHPHRTRRWQVGAGAASSRSGAEHRGQGAEAPARDWRQGPRWEGRGSSSATLFAGDCGKGTGRPAGQEQSSHKPRFPSRRETSLAHRRRLSKNCTLGASARMSEVHRPLEVALYLPCQAIR